MTRRRRLRKYHECEYCNRRHVANKTGLCSHCRKYLENGFREDEDVVVWATLDPFIEWLVRLAIEID